MILLPAINGRKEKIYFKNKKKYNNNNDDFDKERIDMCDTF